MKKCILLLSTMFVFSCTTMTEQGYEALEAGRTEEALSIFQKLTEKEDVPSEAREGLRKAQQQWIERKLIDVRLLRLGENIGGSESLLKEIVQRQTEWQSFPTRVAYATQMEEIQLYSERVKERIYNAVKQKNPLLAQFEYNTHQFILNKALTENTSKLQNQIFKEAEDFCNQESKQIQSTDYFKQIWLLGTCRIWGLKLKEKKVSSSVRFFKNIVPKIQIQNLDQKETDVLSQHLTKAFQNSKWYKPDGAFDLLAELKGEFTSEVKEKDVIRTARYFVDVPYEETYKRVRDVKEKNESGFGALLGVLFSSSSSERVTNNGDGTETVHVTKYYKEKKDYPYKVVEVRASKNLDGEIVYSLDRQSMSYKVAEVWSLLEDRHKENFGEAGLKPHTPVIPSHEQWLASLGDNLIEKLTDSLQTEWINRFCMTLNSVKSTDPKFDEMIHRCGYQINGVIPTVMNQYYLDKWKIGYNDYRSIIVSAENQIIP